jgi:tetratricopeptide (TPR) repeat protein
MPPLDARFESAKAAFVAGDLAATEEHCRAMIATAPRDARPWIILGDVDLRRGRPDSAMARADRAVALAPQDPFAHLVRCKCLIAKARLNDALETAERAVGIAGCPPVALYDFGLLFSQLGRHRRAFDMFGLAAEAEPRNHLFLYNLAVAERTFGALEESERHCDQVIGLDPDFHRAYFIRADLRQQTAARNHVAEMEALIKRGIADPGGAVLVRFALGKECDDIGDYARAFRHLKEGADLQRRLLRYDVRSNIAIIDRIIRAQTREVLSALAARNGSAGHPFSADDPIFIVGLPRSGTTLIERIVAGHGTVAAAGELGAFPSELIRVAKRGGVKSGGEWVERLASLDLPSLGRAYSRVARETGIPDGLRFTDKFPGNYLYCGAIHAALPHARIIVLTRRPMDMCFALYKAHFAAGAYPFSYDFDELAEYYAAYRRLIAHWRSTLPDNSLLEVSYEETVADPEGQSRRIFGFLDLPWNDEVLRFHESDRPATTASAVQVRRPIYTSSVGKWRCYAKELEPLRAKLAERLPVGEVDPPG